MRIVSFAFATLAFAAGASAPTLPLTRTESLALDRVIEQQRALQETVEAFTVEVCASIGLDAEAVKRGECLIDATKRTKGRKEPAQSQEKK